MNTHDGMEATMTRRLMVRGSLAVLGGTGMLLVTRPIVRGQETTPVTVPAQDRLPAPTHADLPYVAGGTPEQVLDLYIPETTGSSSLPLMIWFHGGGWVKGTKSKVGVPYLYGDGFAIASVEYRLLETADPPAQIQDANAAISYLWEEAGTYGLDRDRFVLGGSSAGGFSTIVAGLSANNDIQQFKTNPDVRLAALVDFFGTATQETWSPRNPLQELPDMTDAERDQLWDLLDPLQYVDAGDPPVLILHGELDQVVPIEGSELLTAELQKAGVPVTFKRYPDAGHGLGMANYADARETVRTFLADVLA